MPYVREHMRRTASGPTRVREHLRAHGDPKGVAGFGGITNEDNLYDNIVAEFSDLPNLERVTDASESEWRALSPEYLRALEGRIVEARTYASSNDGLENVYDGSKADQQIAVARLDTWRGEVRQARLQKENRR